MEMDFERIDINQCPKGQGNDGPNRFADTARCKETTEVTFPFLIVQLYRCLTQFDCCLDSVNRYTATDSGEEAISAVASRATACPTRSGALTSERSWRGPHGSSTEKTSSATGSDVSGLLFCTLYSIPLTKI